MSEMDRQKIRLDRMTDYVDRLANQIKNFSLDPRPIDFGPLTLDFDPFSQFKEKLSLLLQHADRWRLFHIISAQPLPIHHTMALFAKGNREAPLLKDFRLETSRSRREMSDLTSKIEKMPPFISAVQRLTLCCGILPVEFGPHFPLPRSMLRGLRELELTKMERLDHSLCFGILRGLPNLRVLKFIDVTFSYVDPFEAVVDSRWLVLGVLEELTFEELGSSTFGPILEFLSAPKLQLLSCNRLEVFGTFVTILQRRNRFPNLRKAKFQSISSRPAGDGDSKWMWYLYSGMPEVTSIHIDSASQALAPLIQGDDSLQGFANEPALLPALSEISVSGFTGDDIIKLVKVRREQGVPLKSVRIDRGSIVSGAVSLKDWE